MPRLRTTASLSLLALFVGIGGTAWLSGLTAGWKGPPTMARAAVPRAVPVAVRHRPAVLPPKKRRPVPRREVAAARPVSHAPWLAVQTHVRAAAAASPAPAPAPVELVPVAMPPSSVPYQAMRGHLDGQVLLHLSVDGQGRVAAATVAGSSGDALLDAQALASVRRWRFAVPAGHPGGISGDLPMRFTAGGGEMAQAAR